MRNLALLLCALLLSGCHASKPPAASETKVPPGKEFSQITVADAGRIDGKVRLEGHAAPAKRISMDAEKACQDLQKTPVYDEVFQTGKHGALANVFVYIKSGLEGWRFPPPDSAVVIEQKGCQFLPRVVGLRTGQVLEVKNSDPVSHNIHPQPKENRDWNQQQPPGAEDLKRKFGYPEVMIPVKCNIHAWMKSYIGVLPHPYFAVTPADGGFSFQALPAGKYTVAAWHEQLGEITQEVTVTEGKSTPVEFQFR